MQRAFDLAGILAAGAPWLRARMASMLAIGALLLSIGTRPAEAQPSDRDGDGVVDAADNCPFTYNPSQSDSNSSGAGDACELGGEFQVNTYTGSQQATPSVAMDANGNFVITWHSDQDGSGTGIYAQRYDSDGNPMGGEFRVNTYTSSS